MTKIYEQLALEMPSHKEVRLRMANLQLCGSGVFSNVYKGTLLRREGNKEIAIKKTWPDCKREKNFEVTFLIGENRRPHKNVISMMFLFTGKARDGKICESLVFEFMPETFYSLIRNSDIDLMDMKLYTWQIFSGLHYLSTMDVVHRDLKPVNILVDSTSGLLRISDFGSAKIITDGMRSTPYQVTRYYRPPELLLGAKQYDYSVDVWSGGCCVGEILAKKTLLPGKDSKHQLRLVLAFLGLPTPNDLRAMKCNARLEGNRHIQASGLKKLLPHAPKEAVDFLSKILVYKPKERLCGLKLLKHPFFEELFAVDAVRHNNQPIASIIDMKDLKMAEMDEVRKGERQRDAAVVLTKKSNTNIVKISSGTLSAGDPDTQQDVVRPPTKTAPLRSKMSNAKSTVKGSGEQKNASEMRSLMGNSQYKQPKSSEPPSSS